MGHDQETHHARGNNHSGNGQYQPWLGPGPFGLDGCRGGAGFRRGGGYGRRYGRARGFTGFRTVSDSALRSLLRGIGLHLATYPLPRPTWV